MGLARSTYYQAPVDWQVRDTPIMEALNDLVDQHPRWGVWKYIDRLKALGLPWNHKRIYRIYRQLGLNQARRTKRRVPTRPSLPVFVPEASNEVWSADFMSDALYHGTRFRTFNIIDDYNREVLAIEVDTSLKAERVIRVLDRLKTDRELPHMIRVDNGPEFLAQSLLDWGKANRVLIYHIQPGRPTQNAFIERFNRTYRNEVLNLYLFRSLEEVRELTANWMIVYNEQRPHASLRVRHPVRMPHYRLKTLVMNCPLDGEAYNICCPDLARSDVHQVTKQIGIHLVGKMPFAGGGLTIQGMNAHLLHQRRDMAPPDLATGTFE